MILLGFRYLASSIPLVSLAGVGIGVGLIFSNSSLFSVSICSFTTINGHAFLDCPFLGAFFIIIAILVFIFSSIILILYLYKIGFSSPSLIITFILSTLLVISNILLIAGLSFKYYCFCVFFNYLTFFTSTWIFFIGISIFIHSGSYVQLYGLIKSLFK
jgi:hypothetical protein